MNLVTLRLAYERAITDRDATYERYLTALEAVRHARDALGEAGGLDCENRCGKLAKKKYECQCWYCSDGCHEAECRNKKIACG